MARGRNQYSGSCGERVREVAGGTVVVVVVVVVVVLLHMLLSLPKRDGAE